MQARAPARDARRLGVGDRRGALGDKRPDRRPNRRPAPYSGGTVAFMSVSYRVQGQRDSRRHAVVVHRHCRSEPTYTAPAKRGTDNQRIIRGRAPLDKARHVRMPYRSTLDGYSARCPRQGAATAVRWPVGTRQQAAGHFPRLGRSTTWQHRVSHSCPISNMTCMVGAQHPPRRRI